MLNKKGIILSKLLKEEISPQKIKKLTGLIKTINSDFDTIGFEDSVLDEYWDNLALKQRIRKLSEQLYVYLNSSYLESLKVLEAVSVEFSGLFHFVFADYVEIYGLNDFEPSMQALALFTKNSTAEFAIRAFLNKEPEKTKQQLLIWSKSNNEHLRRLASEGVRPRLPWATHLTWIAENPEWVGPILENLKSDSSRYVQKSVANLVNDLSKSQEKWVLELIETWLKHESSASPETKWICKHALRTLLKQGNVKALALIGYGDIHHIKLNEWQLDENVKIGEVLNGQFTITSQQPLGRLRLEYALRFLRKSQSPYRKVFKLAESCYETNCKTFNLRHNFKVISTRNYVPGLHTIELMINGQTINTSEFELQQSNNSQQD